MTTWLWTGRSGVRIPAGDRDYFLIRNVSFASRTHPIACSVGTGVPAQGSGGWGLILTAHLRPLPICLLACTGTSLPWTLHEGECVFYNYVRLSSWCILSLFVGAEAAWIPNKVLVWDEIRNPRVDGTSLLSTTVAEFHFEAGRWQIEIGIRYGERNKFREPESRERGLWHCDNCRHCILVMSCASYSSSFLYVFFHFLHFLYLLSTLSISSI
jgi:hypothetical protein